MRRKQKSVPASMFHSDASPLEKSMVWRGTCMGPGGCLETNGSACKNCGWNRNIHSERLAVFRADGVHALDGK